MGFRSSLSKPLAQYIVSQQQSWMYNAPAAQDQWRQQLVNQAKNTSFGRDHFFKDIRMYEDFKQAVPVRDYEDLKGYIHQIIDGQDDVLWP